MKGANARGRRRLRSRDGLFAAGLGLLAALPQQADAQFALEPDWARRPDTAEVSRQYPPLALALGVEGQVVMSCDVTATGSLTSCSIPEETPKGFGFGQAARTMAASFQMRPGIGMSRRSPHGDVRIPLYFRLPAPPPAPPPPALSPEAKAMAARLIMGADPAPGFLAYYDQEAAKLANGGPGLSQEVGREAADALRDAARAKAPALRQVLGEAVAARLSPTDLANFVAFTESPTGRRWMSPDEALRPRYEGLGRAQRLRLQTEARRRLCQARDCTVVPERPEAPGEAGPDATLSTAPWASLPDFRQTFEAWPISLLFGIGGWTRLECTIGLLGAAEDCDLAYESPKGLGLEPAARLLADRLRITADALPAYVGKRVSVRQYFLGWSGPSERAPDPPVPTVPASRMSLARQIVELQAQRLEARQDETEAASLEPVLKPLAPGLRDEVRSTLFAARDATRPQALAARAALLAEVYDETELSDILRFEQTTSPAIQRAAEASDAEAKAYSLLVGDQVSTLARTRFCKARDCTPPVFTQPRPERPPPSN